MTYAVWYAFNDFLYKKRGRTEECKIKNIKHNESNIEKLVKNEKKICIDLELDREETRESIMNLIELVSQICLYGNIEEVHINIEKSGFCKTEFMKLYDEIYSIEIKKYKEKLPNISIIEKNINEYDVHFKMCRHIKEVEENILPVVYIDKYLNCIMTEKAANFYINYDKYLNVFVEVYRELIKDTISKKDIRYDIHNQ